MFSFVIWDIKEEKLFAARDRFGIKPFYYFNNERGFFFASEIKALLPFLKNKKIDNDALSDYFCFQFYLEEKNLISEVLTLPPGNYAILKNKKLTINKYWDIKYQVDQIKNEKWYYDHLDELLNDTMDLHLLADVEVGSYLSGGIDSSLMTALASQHSNIENFKAYNVRFFDQRGFDESFFAESLASKLNLDLNIVNVTEDDFIKNIEKVIWHLDQPMAGPGSFPQYMISKKVSEDVKVVLGGQGGDEIFGGYARYLLGYFDQCIKNSIDGTLNNKNLTLSFESILNNLNTLKEYKPLIEQFFSKNFFSDRGKRYWSLINRSNDYGDVILDGVINLEKSYEGFKQIFFNNNIKDDKIFNSMTNFDFQTLLPALLNVEDRMSMAHGVEARVPLLDHKIIEFSTTIPASIKFKNGILKRMLKNISKKYLNPEILNRRDKMGLPVPLNKWLREKNGCRDFVFDILTSSKAKSRFYIDKQINIDRILESQGNYSRNIWALLSLEIWQNKFIDT